MNKRYAQNILIISSVLVAFWAGFVSSISFMEAWMKFRAPGITLPLGLGIGKLVFSSLNLVEWFFLVACIALLGLYHKSFRFLLSHHLLQVILAILLIQTFWLLPGLVQRADLIMAGSEPADSNIHIYYVVLEIIKVGLLVALAVRQGLKTSR